MILMALVALGFTFGMPKLMENSMCCPESLDSTPLVFPLSLRLVNSSLANMHSYQWTLKCAPNSRNSLALLPSEAQPEVLWLVAGLPVTSTWLAGWPVLLLDPVRLVRKLRLRLRERLLRRAGRAVVRRGEEVEALYEYSIVRRFRGWYGMCVYGLRCAL